jgi:hypothetical protein
VRHRRHYKKRDGAGRQQNRADYQYRPQGDGLGRALVERGVITRRVKIHPDSSRHYNALTLLMITHIPTNTTRIKTISQKKSRIPLLFAA